MSDVIEKEIELAAPVSRVWRALTDYREFGEWFRVAMEGPFEVGKVARGKILHPGYEHVTWEATIERMEPEQLFSLRWHPYAVDPNVDYSTEPRTLVEFQLTPNGGGTTLRLVESGFGAIPKERQFEAFRMNDQGWTEQMRNIKQYVERPA